MLGTPLAHYRQGGLGDARKREQKGLHEGSRGRRGRGPDVVLMKSDPLDVLDAIALSRATLRKMHQNLLWAVAYNVVAFPAAAGVFYPFVISPEVAALSMSGSSVLVAVNALLLKRTKLGGTN
jgi:hypothetical protein